MKEVVAITGGGDDAPSRAVDLFARGTDYASSNGCSLSFLQHRVGISDLSGWRAQIHAAGDIAAVAIHRATEIAQQNFVLADHAIAGAVVWRRRIFAGGNNGEVHHLMALGQNALA